MWYNTVKRGKKVGDSAIKDDKAIKDDSAIKAYVYTAKDEVDLSEV